jgi:hypothetical protein
MLNRTFALRLAITIALSALLAVGIALALPRLARSRAESLLRERLGTDVTIADASVGLGAVELEGVAITGTGVTARLDRVRADASLFGLLVDGSAAVHAVAVTGGVIDADLSSELVRRLASRSDPSPSSASSSTPAPARTLAVSGVRLALSDGAEPLLEVREASARWDGSTLSVVLQGTSMGANAAELVEVDASRTGGVLLASRVHLADVSVSADDVEGPTPLSRLRAAVRAVRPAEDGAAAPEQPEEPTLADRLDAIERHLEPAFRFEVEGVTIHRIIDGEPSDIVSGARASIVRIGGGGYHTEGEGSPRGGGSLAWNLDLAPRVPTASGTVTLDRVALATFVPFLPPIPFYEPEHATLSGHLALDGQAAGGDAETVHADGTLAVEGLALEHTRLAPEPVRGITFQLRGTADFTPSARRLVVPALTLAMGGAEASLHGTFEWTEDHYLFDFGASLPRTSCDVAVHAIPRDLLAETAAFHLVGNLAASLDASIDSRRLADTTLRIHVANACEFTAFPEMADVSRFLGPFRHRVEEPGPAGAEPTVFEMETGPGTGEWTPISEISPFLVHAVLGHEDSSFFTHSGFAPWAIRDALVRNLTAGRYVLGASTITMQLVKNVFLHREKTLARKIQEVLLTWWIESSMAKERILELYLNVIEYGPAVYGIRHAAEHYFGRAPSELSPAESAYLALILPNPPAFHEQYEQGEIPRAFRGRIASFIRLMGSRGRYDEAAVAAGVAEAETLSFHREGDPPPAPRVLQGAVAPLPITFFSTVPLARLSVTDGETEGEVEGEPDDDDDEGFVDPWDEL